MNSFLYDAGQIREKARLIRRHIITLNANSPAGGHTGADLSETDILATLYFRMLNVGPERTEDPERDIYIQSKGHGVGGLYCCLAEAGYFPLEWLPTYQHFNSHLPGHPVRQKTPGIELNTGALGHGLPVAVGIALAAKNVRQPAAGVRADRRWRTGRGVELGSGHVRGQVPARQSFRDCGQEPLATGRADRRDHAAGPARRFGFGVSECDGHAPEQLIERIEAMQGRKGAPQVLIAHTVKGKGVSFIEARPEWHHRVPKGDEILAAMEELKHV
jgi:transketolase